MTIGIETLQNEIGGTEALGKEVADSCLVSEQSEELYHILLYWLDSEKYLRSIKKLQ